jgi:hypothetical protein
MPIRKGNWSKDEDSWLKEAIKKCKKGKEEYPWTEIAKDLPIQRTAKQCRERWMQHLTPPLDKTPLSPEETQYINNFVLSQGHQWANISRYLSHRRSDNQIKNWYYSGANRAERTHIEIVLTERRSGRKYITPPPPETVSFEHRTLPLPPREHNIHHLDMSQADQRYYFPQSLPTMLPQIAPGHYGATPMFSNHQYPSISLAPPRRDITPNTSPISPHFPHGSRENSVMNVGNLLNSHDRFI